MIEVGDAAQETVGGRYFLFTVISVEQGTLCLYLSETVTVTVYFPGWTPAASKVAVSPVPLNLPPFEAQA